jgi:tetratricopeptide (TPR) repeat protein
MAAVTRIDETLPLGAHDPGRPLDALAPGATLGHFRITRPLGAGGMGVVVEAYDPDLDRHVAIKLVRDPRADDTARARLTREAQVMAKLAHPNVVPVHEVGTVGSQVYIVMELIRGGTLARWLERPRRWRDIVRVFLEAGRGLEAAHRAGLVHRDFKPTNVMVDDDQHVRVGDFGLAGGSSTGGSGPAGTPEYMAPEQREGRDVDARADQYAFAVSLDRALAVPSVIGRAPRRVRRALARARGTAPGDRFETLDDLLRELRGAIASRRHAIAAIVVCAVAVGAVASALAFRAEPADDCTAGVELVDSVWSGLTPSVVRVRFEQQRPGMPAIDSTVRAIDRWTEGWRLDRRAACRAEPAGRPARLACLDRDLGDLRAQLAVWMTADAAVVDRALSAAGALPDLDACTMQSGGAPSLLAAALHDRAARISAETRSGHASRVATVLPGLRAAAEASREPRAIAETFDASAVAERELGALAAAREHAARAALEAGRADDDDLVLRALAHEAVLLTDLGEPRTSLGVIDAAAAVAERTHRDRRALIAGIRGDALTQAGDVQRAIPELERAVALIEPRTASDPTKLPALATTFSQLSAAYDLSGNTAKARTLLVRCLAIDEQTLGRDHPETAKTLHDLAEVEARLGDNDAALAHLARARKILVAAYGEHHLLVVGVDLVMAGVVHASRGAVAAEPLYARAARALEALVPPDHPLVGTAEEGLGYTESDQDRCSDALPHLARALAIEDRAGTRGTKHARRATLLGGCLSDLGRFAEARPLLEGAIRDFEASGVSAGELTSPMSMLADLEVRVGHRAQAIALAKHILALLGNPPAPPWDQIARYERAQLARWSP